MESIVAVVAAKQLNLKLLMVKLDYITNILPQTGWPKKLALRLQKSFRESNCKTIHFRRKTLWI